MAVQVYLFAREWMILHLMTAVDEFLGTIRPKDALRILALLVYDKNNIRAKCLKVGIILIITKQPNC
jgi:hypothetical protein